MLAAFVCGVYPFLFFYSNNFDGASSIHQLLYYFLYYILSSLASFLIGYTTILKSDVLTKYKYNALFVLIIITTAVLLFRAMGWSFKRTLFFAVITLFFAVVLSVKYKFQYKKVLIIIGVVSLIPLFKNLVYISEYFGSQSWKTLPDDIENTVFKSQPNIYIIQPDGYVPESLMAKPPYNYNSEIYDWLKQNSFKVYDSFRSNYPSSLVSNASMFCMKQHKFNESIIPTRGLIKSREIICGNNPVIDILHKNGYYTNFVVQDEYFQSNGSKVKYNKQNVNANEIPYYSFDNEYKRDVMYDFKNFIIENEKIQQPKFYFVEVLLPHHIYFQKSLEKDRAHYVSRINEANDWLKEAVEFIETNDENSIIVILADHGGWLGVENNNDMSSTTDKDKINSIYGTLAAIKWNGHLIENFDADLTTNVNLFRVLFANLSKNKNLLNHLEDNSSYNLKGGVFGDKIMQVMDNSGNHVYNKLN